MKRFMRLSVLAFALLAISPLSFADAPAQPSASTDGWYAGLGAGYEGFQAVQKPWVTTTNLGSYSTNADGWVGHLFAGYGATFVHNIYFGLEGFVGTSGASGSNSTLSIEYGGTFSANNSYGASIIPGYRCPKTGALYYGRAGVVQTQFIVKDTLSGFSNSSTTWVTGLNLGLGVELPVYHQFSVRFEYDYFDYSSFNNNGLVGSRNEVSDNRGTIDLKYNFGSL